MPVISLSRHDILGTGLPLAHGPGGTRRPVAGTPTPGAGVDEVHIGDAEHMDWALYGQFCAICTSPTYGNRMADHHNLRRQGLEEVERVRVACPGMRNGANARLRVDHEDVWVFRNP